MGASCFHAAIAQGLMGMSSRTISCYFRQFFLLLLVFLYRLVFYSVSLVVSIMNELHDIDAAMCTLQKTCTDALAPHTHTHGQTDTSTHTMLIDCKFRNLIIFCGQINARARRRQTHTRPSGAAADRANARTLRMILTHTRTNAHAHTSLFVRRFAHFLCARIFMHSPILIICLVRSLNDRVCIIIRVQFRHRSATASFCNCRRCLLVPLRLSFGCIFFFISCACVCVSGARCAFQCSIPSIGRWPGMGSRRRHADGRFLSSHFTHSSQPDAVGRLCFDGTKSINIYRLCGTTVHRIQRQPAKTLLQRCISVCTPNDQ